MFSRLCILTTLSCVLAASYGSFDKYREEPVELIEYQNADLLDSQRMELFKSQYHHLHDQRHKDMYAAMVNGLWLVTGVLFNLGSIGFGYQGGEECLEPCRNEHRLDALAEASAISSFTSGAIGVVLTTVWNIVTDGRRKTFLAMLLPSALKLAVIGVLYDAYSRVHRISRGDLCDTLVWTSAAHIAFIFLVTIPKLVRYFNEPSHHTTTRV